MREFSSFRDPSGHVFYNDGKLCRQINPCYRAQYDQLMQSGLYQKLISQDMLVSHHDAPAETGDANAYCVIEPEKIPFITYPYEWSFSQLKDAALTTLRIHRSALDHGMILKDASAYNIQFDRGTAKLIDTLSFDFYKEGTAWVAYGQFCRHFLAPLLLMRYVDVRLSQLLRLYIDGIPLDLADRLLQGKGGFTAAQHIRWHAKSVAAHTEDGKQPGQPKSVHISRFNHIALIESLIRAIERLSLGQVKTEWMDYYDGTNYTDKAQAGKEAVFSDFIRSSCFASVWDFGANDGRFSRIALANGAELAVAFDSDPIAVEKNYLTVKQNRQNIVPLLFDVTNPSPGIGFANRERLSVEGRGKPDCIVALAFIHHLAISNNLPLTNIAAWLEGLTDSLIIEFVPKEDSQVRLLLATRDDIFPDYRQDAFEQAFSAHFVCIRKEAVQDSARTIYFYQKGTNE